MSEPDQLSSASMAIIDALLGTSPRGTSPALTDDELVRFACKWCSDAEEERILEELTRSDPVRSRLAGILDQIQGKREVPELYIASEGGERSPDPVAALARRAVNATICAIAALSRKGLTAAMGNTDGDQIRVLKQKLKGFGLRTRNPSLAFGTLRGSVADEVAVHVDAGGALRASKEVHSAAGKSSQELWLIAKDPELGDWPIASAPVVNGKWVIVVPELGNLLGLPEGRVAGGTFAVSNSKPGSGAKTLELLIKEEESTAQFHVFGTVEIREGAFSVGLELPSNFTEVYEGYAIRMNLNAGSLSICLGSWKVRELSERANLDGRLPGIESDSLPPSCLEFYLEKIGAQTAVSGNSI